MPKRKPEHLRVVPLVDVEGDEQAPDFSDPAEQKRLSDLVESEKAARVAAAAQVEARKREDDARVAEILRDIHATELVESAERHQRNKKISNPPS